MYAWSSGQFIGMFTAGAVLAIAFVLYEWKLAPVPIMPCTTSHPFSSMLCHANLPQVRLFQAAHCPYMYGQSLMMGIGFYGNFFYSNPPPPPLSPLTTAASSLTMSQCPSTSNQS